MKPFRPPLPLDSAARKRLRGEAMLLKPALIIGKAGPTSTVIIALDTLLSRSGLVKIRLEAPDRNIRKSWLHQISESTGSTICGEVGHTASLYRPVSKES